MSRKSALMILMFFLFTGSKVYALQKTDIATNTISVFGDDCFAIKNDGSLWRWSSDYEPSNTTDTDMSPKKILDNVKSIDTYYAIKDDGSWWVCDPDTTSEPMKVMDSVISAIQANGYSLFIKDDLSLWGFGNNFEGALGQREFYKENCEMFKIMNNAVQVINGFNHTVVLRTDGSVWTFGGNYYGQLGNGNRNDTYVKSCIMNNGKYINAGISSTFVITDNDCLWRCGTNYGEGVCLNYDDLSLIKTTPVQYIKDVKQVNSQIGYNLVLKTNGELWMYGEDETEQQGCSQGPYSRAVYFDLPQKLKDNVYSINNSIGGYGSTVLVLTNEGTLFKYDLIEEEPYKGRVQISKIMDDVRIPNTITTQYKNHYSDVIGTQTNVQEAVEHLTKAGIMKGVTETEFMPDKAITRAETAALLLRMTGKGDETGGPLFIDVAKSDWYYNTAGASEKYGIINGYEDNTFRGNETVSELQLAALAARTLQREETAIEPENIRSLGEANIPEWAYDDIEYALNHEIITEEEAKSISDKPMTRGEAAVILYRLYNVV